MTDDRFFNFDTMQPGDSVTLLVSGTRPDEESGRWAKRTPVRVTRCAESYGRPADNFTYATDTAAARYETQPGDHNPGHEGLYRFVQEHGARLFEAVEESGLVRRAYRAERRRDAGKARAGGLFFRREGDAAAHALRKARAAVARPFRNGGNGEWLRWIENPESKGLRFVGYADEIDSGIRHTGWFLDSEFRDETARGVVYQLPAKDGRARFLAGYTDSFNDGPAALTVVPIVAEPGAAGFIEWRNGYGLHCDRYSAREDQESKNDSAEEEAARLADSIAEHMAEAGRDYQNGFRAGAAAREMAAEARDAGRRMVALCRDVRALWRLRRGAGLIPGPTIRDHLRRGLSDLRTLRDDYREKLAEAREARDDSPAGRWYPGGPDHAAAGWRDGYAEGGAA